MKCNKSSAVPSLNIGNWVLNVLSVMTYLISRVFDLVVVEGRAKGMASRSIPVSVSFILLDL